MRRTPTKKRRRLDLLGSDLPMPGEAKSAKSARVPVARKGTPGSFCFVLHDNLCCFVSFGFVSFRFLLNKTGKKVFFPEKYVVLFPISPARSYIYWNSRVTRTLGWQRRGVLFPQLKAMDSIGPRLVWGAVSRRAPVKRGSRNTWAYFLFWGEFRPSNSASKNRSFITLRSLGKSATLTQGMSAFCARNATPLR